MKPLLLCIILVFSSASQTLYSMSVTAWTKKTLIKTLSVDFKSQIDNTAQNPNEFTPNAWAGLSSFLGEYLETIRDQRLIIHPRFLIEPTIIDSGSVSGIRYWRVNEEVLLPEVKVKVAFSLVILATRIANKDSYIIQTVDMVKQENP